MTWISVFNGAKFVILEIILAVYLASHVDDVVKSRHNNLFKLWAERGKSRSMSWFQMGELDLGDNKGW
jgi:hypothetical protein